MKTKNKELRQNQSNIVEEEDKLVEDEMVVIESIVEYDVEIQTDLFSREIDAVFNNTVTQREVVVEIPQQSTLNEGQLVKELKQKNNQINDLHKRNSELEERIKHHKKVIQNINNQKKELYLQVHKVEEPSLEIEEVQIIEYEVEIQTDITSFNFEKNLLTTEPHNLTEKVKVYRKKDKGDKEESQIRERLSSGDLSKIVIEDISDEKELKKTINRLKNELHKTFSSNKVLKKQV